MRVDAPPEFRLVAACAIWPPSERRVGAVRAAAAGIVDWPRFLRIVKRHRVTGLVQDGLVRADIAVPSEVAAALAAQARALVATNLAYAGEAVRLQRLFDGAGIAVAFMKGVPLAMLAYGTLGLRQAKDIDILIAADDVERASLQLGDAGYERVRPPPGLDAVRMRRWLRYGKDIEWRHRQSGRLIDMHWALTDIGSVLPELPARADYRDVTIAEGLRLRTFGDDVLFAYLCVHGAFHGWCRLKWLADIGALLVGRDDGEIERLYRMAEGQGAGRSAAQALLLCERLFGTALPAGLMARLRRDPAVRFLERIGWLAMTRGNAETEIYDLPFGTGLVVVSHLLLMPGWRHGWAQLWKMSLSLDDVIAYPLPEGWYFLYRVMRGPFWLWRQMRKVLLGTHSAGAERRAERSS
jgi:hypothetical protein